MKELTLVKNHSAAPNVTTNAQTKVIWRAMKELTLVKNLSAAQNVESHFHLENTSKNMKQNARWKRPLQWGSSIVKAEPWQWYTKTFKWDLNGLWNVKFLKITQNSWHIIDNDCKAFTSFSFQNKTRQKGLQSKCRPMLLMLASVCCYCLFATKAVTRGKKSYSGRLLTASCQRQ